MARRREKRQYCSVFGCSNSSLTDPGTSFFTLPSNSERRLEWLELICRDDLVNKPNYNAYRVCAKHFKVEDIRSSLLHRRRLKKNVRPSMLLPSSTNIVRKEVKQTQTAENYTQTNGENTTCLFCNNPRKRKLETELYEYETQNMEKNSNTSDNESESQDVNSVGEVGEYSNSADESSDEDISVTSNPTESIDKVLKNRNIIEKIGQIHKTMAKIDGIANSLDKDEDEFDIFGKYIATTLRSLPGKLSIAAKIGIQKTISEIQLKALNQTSQPPMLSYETVTTPTYDPLNPELLIVKLEPL